MATLPSSDDLSSHLRVITVGTGTCVPRLDRRGACTLVQTARLSVAVDLGLGSLHGLLRLGIGHVDVDAVFLTHLHPDHTAELASLLFAANYDERPRQRPLSLTGGPGCVRYVEALQAAHRPWLEPKSYPLTVRELIAGEEVRLGPLRCRSGAVRHIESSLAYRFEVAGRSAVISGDTGPSPELEDLARGADLLVVEASLPEAGGYEGHVTARQAGELGRRAGVGRLILTHLYPTADAESPERAAAEAFAGPVVVAWDGMEVLV